MAYEFKRLSDVEVIEEPSEYANVLIEEDGVIKRAPKAVVGGNNNNGGDNDCDAIFIIDGSNFNSASMFIEGGSFELVAKKMSNNIFPKISIVWWRDVDVLIQPINVVMFSEDGSTRIEIAFMDYSNIYTFNFYPDNTVEVVGEPE